MKGIVFNLLEEVVIAHHGEDTWDTLLDAAGLDGTYTSLGSYPDADIGKLVAVAAKALGISEIEVQRWFGREAMPMLAKRYPGFLQATQFDAQLRHQREQHHSSGGPQGLSGRRCADLRFHAGRGWKPADGLPLPPSPLRAGARNFIEGAAIHFHETAEVDHLECMHHGKPQCLMRLAFRPAA